MRKFLAAMTVFISLAAASCGDDHHAPPTFVTDILSEQGADGDIELSAAEVFTITQGAQSVFAGVSPGTLSEFRAFLDFPLWGTGGVPGDAVIVSATLDIVINSVSTQSPDGTVPIRIDLVELQPPLITADFDRIAQPALATMTFSPPISGADAGQHVVIDVTSLMIEAQRLGLLDFQLRILEELGPVYAGIIEINDSSGVDRPGIGPLLEVAYQ